MNSNNDENVDSPKQPQLKDNHFSCSLKELQAMQLTLFRNQWRIQGRGLGGPSHPPPHHPPLMFRPKWGPKGQKKIIFWGRLPCLSYSLDDRLPPLLPPLSEGLDPPLVTPQYLEHFTCGCLSPTSSGPTILLEKLGRWGTGLSLSNSILLISTVGSLDGHCLQGNL